MSVEQLQRHSISQVYAGTSPLLKFTLLLPPEDEALEDHGGPWDLTKTKVRLLVKAESTDSDASALLELLATSTVSADTGVTAPTAGKVQFRPTIPTGLAVNFVLAKLVVEYDSDHPTRANQTELAMQWRWEILDV